MPFYKIDIVLRSNEPGKNRKASVVRQYKELDIERVWQALENKSREKYGGMLKVFNCVQISKRSPEYQLYFDNYGRSKKNQKQLSGAPRHKIN